MGVVETMVDGLGGPEAFNYCSHQKEHWECPPIVTQAKTACNPPYQAGTLVTTEFAVGAHIACALNLNLVPWMGSDEELRAECLSVMNPKVIPRGFDMAQQFGELVEGFTSLAHLVSNVERLVKDITRLNRWNSPAVRRVMGQKTFEDLTLGNWLDLGVAAGLTWRLAITPMLSAIEQAEKARKGFGDALKRVLSSTQTLHGTATREATASTTNGNDYHKWSNTRQYTRTVVCTAKVKFHSPATQSLYDAFETEYFGLRPSLSTAYELYTLSFVLDWFWNFGKFLDRHCRKPIEDIQYSVVFTGWSRKDVVRSNGQVDLLTGPYGITIKDGGAPSPVTGTCTKSTYLREVIPLDLEGGGVVPAPKLTLPSAGQLATLAGLLIAIGRGRGEIFKVAKPG